VSAPPTALDLMLQPVNQAAALLSSLTDPGHLYMRCLGCGPTL
jgi:protease IV